MKKRFFSLFAVAAGLFMASCSNDELEVIQSENEAQVTFALSLENGVQTRAISDGTGADRLIYAVFDKEGNRISTIKAVDRTTTFPATESLTLAKGQTYKVAFWAQDNDCKAYSVNTDKMSVAVDYAQNNKNNDETRDAFFKTEEFTVIGSTSISVELKRPFAQINVGVTEEDWNAAVASGITINQSSVVIKNAATSLDLLTGKVADPIEVNYALGDIINERLSVDVDNDGQKENYHWLSMSYILAADETTGEAKTTLEDLSFVFTPENAKYKNIELHEGLNSVPVQRNWRTNIIGQLLTGNITFNITIDPIYAGENNLNMPYATIGDVMYGSFAEAMAAVKDGETIKLHGETLLEAKADQHLFAIEGKHVTIDLNGSSLVAKIPDITKNTAIFQVKKGATLTIEGKGDVKVGTAKAPNVLAAMISNEAGTVNLKGGNWTMTALDYPAALIPTFVDNNTTLGAATLNIYDGTYTFHRNLFRNFSNNKTEVATMNIYGGTFNGLADDKGAIWNQKPSDNTPEGAGVINIEGGSFNNVEINDNFAKVDYLTVTTAKELTDAIANATKDVTVFLANDITGNAIARQKEGVDVVVNGNGYKYDGTIDIYGAARFDGAETLTLTNINFTHAGSNHDFISCNTRDSEKRYAHNVTVENCTFVGDVTCDVVAMRFRQCYNISVKNVTAKNMHSLMWETAVEGVLIDDVTITDSKNGVSFGGKTSAVVKNSNISATQGYALRMDGDSESSLKVENATMAAGKPIIVRKMTGTCDVTLGASVILNTNEAYQIVFTNGNDDAAYEVPTGNYTIKGAESFKVYGRDMHVSSQEEFENALKGGKVENVYLRSGSYIIPQGAKGKTIRFVGEGNPEEVVVTVTKVGIGGENCDYGLDGSTAVFEGVTIQTNSSTYIGYARCKGTYKNCIINGTYTLYDNSSFDGCTFNVSGDVYNIWTWSASVANFTNCTFNSDGKAMLLYGTVDTQLTIENTVFNDNGGLTDKKAAIEIGNDYSKSYKLVVNNTTVNGYEINDKGINTGTTLWGNKDSMGKDKLNVVVGGVDVY